jgi:hypothetical protein
LVGESAEEVLVPFLSTEVIVCCRTELRGYVSDPIFGENYGDELRIFSLCVVQLLCDDETFPVDAETFPWAFLALVAATVGFGAHYKNKVRYLDLVPTPSRPSLGRTGLVLIDAAVDAVLAEALTKFPDAVRVVG